MNQRIQVTSPAGKHGETKQNEAATTSREEEEELLTFEEVVVSLANVPGFKGREAVRRALVDGRIPSTRVVGRGGSAYRIPRAAIAALVTIAPTAPEVASPDKLLFEHFLESPNHNPVTAVCKGITTSAAYATKIFKTYQKWERASRATRQAEQEAAFEAELKKRAASEPPCTTCGRPYTMAHRESGRIGFEVTGRTDNVFGAGFWREEEEVLVEYKREWKCGTCFQWHAGAPIDAMRKRLFPNRAEGSAWLEQLRNMLSPTRANTNHDQQPTKTIVEKPHTHRLRRDHE